MPGDVVCRKGEYELDLCFVLSGEVDLFDDFARPGPRIVFASLEAGRFYGELGAIGGLPRTPRCSRGRGQPKSSMFRAML